MVFLGLWCAASLQGAGQRGAAAAPSSTVRADSLTVYSEMRTSSAARNILKKGDPVLVDFEFKTAAESWCTVRLASQKVRMGYVECAGLEPRRRPVLEPQPGVTRASAARTSVLAANRVPFTPPSARANSAYEEISGQVVREGAIDVVRLAEFESAAHSGSTAALARAALAHYAAGNFELSRNNNDEAIGQYRSALEFIGKQPDLLLSSLLSLAYVHLRRSEYSAALEYLDRARSLAPRSVAAARLSGWAFYGLDRMDEAVEQWTAAQRLQPSPEVAELLEKAQRDTEAESSFRAGQTSHFIVHYEGSATPQLAADILHALEADFRAFQSEFRFSPQEPVAVVLYTQQNFRDITRAPSWAQAENDGRIRVPVQGLTLVNDQLAQVLKHELTHSFLRQKTQGRCPEWLDEGLAQWMEGRRTGAAKPLIAAYQRAGQGLLRSLEGSWTSLSNEEAGLAYAWSLAVVESVIARSGMWGIERLLNGLTDGSSVEPALGLALQTNYADLERATVEYLRSTHLQQ